MQLPDSDLIFAVKLFQKDSIMRTYAIMSLVSLVLLSMFCVQSYGDVMGDMASKAIMAKLGMGSGGSGGGNLLSQAAQSFLGGNSNGNSGAGGSLMKTMATQYVVGKLTGSNKNSNSNSNSGSSGDHGGDSGEHGSSKGNGGSSLLKTAAKALLGNG